MKIYISSVFLVVILLNSCSTREDQYQKLLYPYDKIYLGIDLADFRDTYKTMNFEDRGETITDKYNKFYNKYGINSYRRITAYLPNSPLFKNIDLFFREDSVKKILFYIELKSKIGIKLEEIVNNFDELGYEKTSSSSYRNGNYYINIFEWPYDPKPCYVEIGFLK